MGNSKARSASVSGSAAVRRISSGVENVEIEARHQPAAIQLVPSAGTEIKGELDRRLPFLIPLFGALVSTAARIGAVALRAGGAVRELTRYTVKVGKGKRSKKSYK